MNYKFTLILSFCAFFLLINCKKETKDIWKVDIETPSEKVSVTDKDGITTTTTTPATQILKYAGAPTVAYAMNYLILILIILIKYQLQKMKYIINYYYISFLI